MVDGLTRKGGRWEGVRDSVGCEHELEVKKRRGTMYYMQGRARFDFPFTVETLRPEGVSEDPCTFHVDSG